jgi:hypothetical protein
MFPALETIGDFVFFRVSSRSLTSSTITSIGFRAFIQSFIDNINLTNSVTFDQQAFEGSQLNTITLSSDCAFADATIFQDVPTLGTAIVNIADVNETAIKYLENDLSWSINP